MSKPSITPWNYNAPIIDPRLLEAFNSQGKVPVTQDMLKASIDFIIWLQQAFISGTNSDNTSILEALDEGAGDSQALRDATQALKLIGVQVEPKDCSRSIRALAESQETQAIAPDLTRRLRAIEESIATLSEVRDYARQIRALSMQVETQGESSAKTKLPISATVLGSNVSRQAIAAPLLSAKIWVGNGANLPVAVSLSGGATVDNAGVVTLNITAAEIIAALGYTPAEAGATASGTASVSLITGMGTASVTQV